MGFYSLAMLLAPSTWSGLCSASSSTSWPQQTFVSESFSVPRMEIKKTGNTGDGYLFYGINEAPKNLKRSIIMDENGELIWAGASGISPYNFHVQNYKNRPVLSYFTGHEDVFGHGYGEVIVLDNAYREVARVCLRNTSKHHFVVPEVDGEGETKTYRCFNDYHESFITDRGSILVSAFNVTRFDLRHWHGPQDGWIFDWQFFDIDIDSGKMLFEWSALEHINPRSSFYINPLNGSLEFDGHLFGHNQSKPWDFFHGNSVSPLPGGHYLVNSRMTHSFYRVNGWTGKVDWTFQGATGGDFKLQDPAPSFSWQHMTRVVSQGSTNQKFQVSLFNDANIRDDILDQPKLISNGLLIDIDTESMTARTARELIDKKEPIFSVAQGSYQTLRNGNVLLGYGAAPFIEEYDVNNTLIYRAQFASTERPVAHTYRAYKQSWQGYPQWPPRLAVDNDCISTSWNGATEYDAWNIYVGNRTTKMVRVAHHIGRRGFETHYKMPQNGFSFKYAMSEALRNGRVLSRSKVIELS